MRVKHIIVTFAVIGLLAVPVSGLAVSPEIGFQDDQYMFDGSLRPDALKKIGEGKGTWVRFMLQEDKFPQYAECKSNATCAASSARFLEALKAAKEAHLNVLVTMFRWQGVKGTERKSPSFAEMGVFATWAVKEFGEWVDAWSPNNEPNHPAFWIATKTRCRVDSKNGASSVTVYKGKKSLVKYRRVEPGKGTYRRITHWIKSSKNGTHRRVHGRWVRSKNHATHWLKVVYRRANGPRARFIRVTSPIPLRPNTISMATAYDRRVCNLQARIDAYRDAYDIATVAIRQYDPSAKIVAMELAPEYNFYLVKQFFNSRRAKPDVDVIGFHSYRPPTSRTDPRLTDIAGINHAVRWAQKKGLEVWVTEAGYHDPSPGCYWSRAMAKFRRAGVKVVIWYELFAKKNRWRWDTALLEHDGAVRPGWNSLLSWLTSRSTSC